MRDRLSFTTNGGQTLSFRPWEYVPTVDLERHKSAWIAARVFLAMPTSVLHPSLVALHVLRGVRRRTERSACQCVRDVTREETRRDRRDIPSDRLSVAANQKLCLRSKQLR